MNLAVNLAAAAAVVVWHAARCARPREELKLIAIAVLIAALWDSALVALGWLSFAEGPARLAPFWILALWALFASTLNVSLGWLPGLLVLGRRFDGCAAR